MRVLWLTNIMLPRIAGALHRESSNKEGWLTGLSDTLLQNRCRNNIELGVCFPVAEQEDGMRGEAEGITYYGFYEDTVHEERYDGRLEEKLKDILINFKPDIVHVFGTEFAHSLAMARAFAKPERTLVGIQGVCYQCAVHYTADLPEHIINRSLFRDWLKKDNIRRQQEKFVMRGEREKELLRSVSHVTGRTAFDRESVLFINDKLNYHLMNESMRASFYEGAWSYDRCEPYSIMLSQGNYPLKGLHYAIEAAAALQAKYPGIMLYVAGDVITSHETWKDKIKISSYGKYLLELLKKYGLEKNAVFIGRLDEVQMKARYLRANVFLSPSSVENSPNSVGEAMLLGMPVVSSDGGGVRSLLEAPGEGWLFPSGDVGALASCLDEVFRQKQMAEETGKRAAIRARATHDRTKNYERLLQIYDEISRAGSRQG